jgi:threonine synthase
MREIKRKFDYTMDPHGAVGYLALLEYHRAEPGTTGIILETAHPSKFKPDVERILEQPVDVPARLAELSEKEKMATAMEVKYPVFRAWLAATFG